MVKKGIHHLNLSGRKKLEAECTDGKTFADVVFCKVHTSDVQR